MLKLLFLLLFVNPVLNEDFSDPDVIRVGSDYYMTASSFNYVPGLPILHSRDLQHWSIVNHALPYRLPGSGDEQDLNTTQHGNFVWAPSIRYHKGLYMIYYGDPDRGIFRVTASDIKGRWNEPELVIEGKGMIDPCPLFTNDGHAYLVHALAGSRAGLKSVLLLTELTEDGSRAITQSRIIYDGHKNNPTCEGPKIHQFNGYFYIFFPAGGVPTGWQSVARSKSIYGPYETRVVMRQGSSKVNGPHQGAWVDTPDGKHCFVHFQDVGAMGRVVHVEPMTWTSDKWPIIGAKIPGENCGQPTSQAASSSEIVRNRLTQTDAPYKWNEWQWNYNIDMRAGFVNGDTLRLFSMPYSDKNLWQSRHLFTRRISGSTSKEPFAEYTFDLNLSPDSRYNGERGGCLVFGKSYAGIVVENNGSNLLLKYVECENADKGTEERATSLGTVQPNHNVRVRVKIYDGSPSAGNTDRNVTAVFYYSTNQGTFWQQANTKPFRVREGVWTGARIALFCTRPDKQTNDSGWLTVKPVK